jgi:glucoamylase
VGTARNLASHVWFTTHHGILGEIFYPRIDSAAARDLGMIVTDGDSFFSEEKTDTQSNVLWLGHGIPAFQITNACKQGHYTIEKTIVADPWRHSILQQIRFRAMRGSPSRYHLYALLAPHLEDRGAGNNAFLDDFKGIPMLMADREGFALALACSAAWLHRSAGYVGVSDGWQDLHEHKQLTCKYDRADDGNVALVGEIDLSEEKEFVLALGFGRNSSEAAHRARASLNHGFDAALERYVKEWTGWQKTLDHLDSGEKANSSAYRTSTAVLATHESKDFQGGTIASLSDPWGEIHGDKDKAGYHVVWPRDAYETASALIAAGATDEVLRALRFFETTQEADGHWPQNMWLDGTEFWKGIQLDEVASPILLLDLARRHEKIQPGELDRLWLMVRKAAGYIVRHGPSTQEDRWEEDAGLTAYTLGAMIAALLVAAEMAAGNNEPKLAAYLRETADAWNDAIERWTYVEQTALAKKVGVDGYYVRIAPKERLSGRIPLTEEMIKIPNLPGDNEFAADAIVSVDSLALVRFGLRAAGDPRIVNTVRVVDAVLKVDTPKGPCWHRYNHDGYGEHEDGSPFDGTGVGRVWPLFAGERAHYELAAGRTREARRLLESMEALASDSGLISEQVWDREPIPEKELFPGRPTGSARPLVWAHAEHVKLLRSLADGKVFDTPPQTVERYLVEKTRGKHAPWRLDAQVQRIPAGHILRIETEAPARIRWSADGWKTAENTDSRDTDIGMYVADLPIRSLAAGARIVFTIYWLDAGNWEGKDFSVGVVN